MYHYIKGLLVERAPTYAVIECSGVAYHLAISLHTYSAIEGLKEVKLLTHFIVKEDAHLLYGFYAEDERQVFAGLISVNGVGPNTARLILSSVDAQTVKNAISQGDVPLFQRIKGIGPKTAQRIIIDLKDKFSKDSLGAGYKPGQAYPLREEALQAMLALGFARPQVENALKKLPDGLSLEEMIKTALKNLS
jgi:holliday junction DNA helicase RuvA